MPRILLSGASGMLGTALQRALAAEGLSVLQLVRRAPVAASQIQWTPTASSAAIPSDAIEDLAAAIHLSGANVAAHRWTAAYKREIAASRVHSTRALATALAGLRHPPQALLVASAVGIYGNRGEELLDESSAPGSGFLAGLCKEWEAAARPAADAGIRVVHLRFGVVLGADGALGRMLPVFRLGLGGRLGSGLQWMSWISLEDAARAILFVLKANTLSGPVNVTAPNPVTNLQFTRDLARELHRPVGPPVPAFMLRLVMGQIADEALLASTRAYPARLTTAGFRFTHPTVAPALAAALAPQ